MALFVRSGRLRFSTCPIGVSERLLDLSPTRVFSAWLEENDPTLSSRVFALHQPAASGGAATAAAPSPLRKGGLAVEPGSPFRGFVEETDPRGADPALYAWARAAFEARMAAAAERLRELGFDRHRPPPYLSPDCFRRPAPDGFSLDGGLPVAPPEASSFELHFKRPSAAAAADATATTIAALPRYPAANPATNPATNPASARSGSSGGQGPGAPDAAPRNLTPPSSLHASATTTKVAPATAAPNAGPPDPSKAFLATHPGALAPGWAGAVESAVAPDPGGSASGAVTGAVTGAEDPLVALALRREAEARAAAATDALLDARLAELARVGEKLAAIEGMPQGGREGTSGSSSSSSSSGGGGHSMVQFLRARQATLEAELSAALLPQA